MKKLTPKRIFILLFALLLAAGVIGSASQLVGYYRADRAYESAQNLLNSDAAQPAPVTESAETELPMTEVETTAVVESEASVTENEPAAEIEAEVSSSDTAAAPETTSSTETSAVSAADEADDGALLNADLAALKEVNPDVIGWIMIPDTSINYPLLQGEDNTHYLDYAWDGGKNAAGAIYMDYRSSPDFADFHTIIYGHRMYRDAMFNALKNYADEDFLIAHPSVYILTETALLRYDIFAAYDADVSGSSYRLGLTEAKGQQALFNYCRKHSVIDSGIVPIAKDGDRLLTLSTCSKDGGSETRWVVHCVLAEITEKNIKG